MSKKEETRDKLFSSAIELFSTQWYEVVSVAEICKHAHLSNGIFYNYYKNKEVIFKAIVEEFLTEFDLALKEVSGKTLEQRLYIFIETVIEFGREKKKMVSIYREAQYRFPLYEKQLRQLYIQTVEKVYKRKVTEEEYLYIVSGLRFVSIRSLYNNLKINKKAILDYILNGVFPKMDFTLVIPENLEPVKEKSINLDFSNQSKENLINSGIRLFAENGYFNISVYDIAKNANLSVGSFYLYFTSKEAFITEIVRKIGKETRQFIRQHMKQEENRLEQEIMGIYHFLRFFNRNKYYYEIVREAEFVVHDAVKEYYDNFERGYLHNLSGIDPDNQRQTANYLMGNSHYFGIEYFFTSNVSNLSQSLLKLADFIRNGICK